MQLLPLEELSRAYSQPDRFFHNLNHISDCLRKLDDAIAHGVAIADPEAVRFALWFHDVVYDGRRADNEELSADACHQAALGHGEVFAATAKRLVLVTKHSEAYAPATPDEELICDIDLTSLAADDFAGNTLLIRKEYAHVPDEEFYPARRRILARFLERERIYRTEFFARKYEVKARRNLEAAVRG
jgi:predicted metal-dependent HD superfamily phosphohydrolase